MRLVTPAARSPSRCSPPRGRETPAAGRTGIGDVPEGRPWLVPDFASRPCRRTAPAPSVKGMGRILLAVAAVVLAFFVLGSLAGLIVGLVKWAVIIGLIAVVVMFVTRLLRSSGSGR